jgi:hypothetical protein
MDGKVGACSVKVRPSIRNGATLKSTVLKGKQPEKPILNTRRTSKLRLHKRPTSSQIRDLFPFGERESEER